MTHDEAKKTRSSDYHDEAMEACDDADMFVKRGEHLSQISFLMTAVHKEERAAWYAPSKGPTKAVLYRSAVTMARQLSVRLAKLGLEGNPDQQLRRELKALVPKKVD